MPKRQIVCSACKAKMPSFRALREHFLFVHADAYDQVQSWLDRADGKLRHAQATADEGMIGANDAHRPVPVDVFIRQTTKRLLIKQDRDENEG